MIRIYREMVAYRHPSALFFGSKNTYDSVSRLILFQKFKAGGKQIPNKLHQFHL